jgi:enoyl-CoA hydratase
MSLVTIERNARPHVSVIRMNRPERLNAMSFGLMTALREAFHEFEADNDCWVAVLTGEGRGFCSGLDLEDPGEVPDAEGLPVSRIGIRAMSHYSKVIPAMRAMPQPIIAAINGCAYGGGLCLSLAAEIRIASESAEFNCTGIVNGLTSTELAASYLLPRLIGASRSSELLLTGRKFGAAEAERIGLVSRVVPDGEVVDEALDIAAGICDFSPHGIAMTKAAIWTNLEISSLAAAIEFEDRNQLLLGGTENLQEFITARRENRKPRYTDKMRDYSLERD